MKECSCYKTKTIITEYSPFDGTPIYKKVAYCVGTKEQDICTCDGYEHKCDFYPEKRQMAIKGELVHSISGNLEPTTLEIKNCEKIKLHHKEIDIDFELPKKVLESIDTITINGIKYVKER